LNLIFNIGKGYSFYNDNLKLKINQFSLLNVRNLKKYDTFKDLHLRKTREKMQIYYRCGIVVMNKKGGLICI
ncbi:P-ATPase superfamily P-type ATPase copper transporter, partial [Peptoniphilus indolicus ATCC 29427]